MADNSAIPNNQQHIFLIDDDDSMRLVISSLLEFMGYQVKSYSSAIEFLKTPIMVAPAVIITDMRMPDMTGVELQAELERRGRQVPIIFISAETTVQQSILAMKQGAFDFLIKPFERDELLAVVTRGLNQDAINMRNSGESIRLQESLKLLSPREREVFGLMSMGFSNSEIQERLQISLPTAKQYKSEVMRKLKLQSLSQLISISSFLEKK